MDEFSENKNKIRPKILAYHFIFNTLTLKSNLKIYLTII